MVDVVQTLSASGLRATPQRIAIYSTLLPRKDHPSVESLYKDIHYHYPTMSLNTLYTTLLSLQQAGLIRRLDVGDGKARYDGNPEPHPHIVCTSCQRVDDVPISAEPALAGLTQEATKASGYSIENSVLFFFGKCAECALSYPND